MDQSTGWADRHTRWVAMWREAVRSSPMAIGLVELSTTRFVEMSDRAAELLSTTPEEAAGLDYLSVTERPREAAQTFRLVRERMLDGIKGRRRFHRPNGSMVELEVTGWAVRSSTGPDSGSRPRSKRPRKQRFRRSPLQRPGAEPDPTLKALSSRSTTTGASLISAPMPVRSLAGRRPN